MKFLSNIDLTLNQLLNALAQQLATDPGSPTEGQFWENTTSHTFKMYLNGSVVVFGTLDQISAPGADVSLNSHKITNLATPVATTDAATKAYVDGLINGASWKNAVRAASTANVVVASPGAAIDVVTLAAGDRVLLKNQTAPAENGLYVWNGAAVAMTRTADANTGAEILQASVFVEEGSTLADTAWVCTTAAPINLGSTSLAFAQIGASATYTASTGIQLVGNDIRAIFGTTTDMTAESSGVAVGAGASGKVADAGHVHAMPTLQNLSAGATGDMTAEAIGSTVSAGATGKYSDAGHRHAMPAAGLAGDIGAESSGASAAAGASGKFADAGHVHSMPTIPAAASGGTPAVVLGTAAAAGVSTTFLRDDDTIVAFDVTVPVTQAFSDAASAGASAHAARRDHTHGMPANPVRAQSTTTPSAIGTASYGSGGTDARADHVHATGAGTPSTQAFGDAAAVGTGPAAAMTDHKHAMPANPVTYATPNLTFGTANAAGAAASVIRSDATILAFDTTAPSTQASGDAAAVGVATTAARRDHKHGFPTLPAVGASGDIVAEASGSTVLAGATGKYADAGHRHAMPTLIGKYAANVGDGAASTFAITHSLGTKDVVVTVFRVASPFDVVMCDVVITDTNNVGLTFATIPTTGQYRVVVVG
jgi:hypothetical protein